MTDMGSDDVAVVVYREEDDAWEAEVLPAGAHRGPGRADPGTAAAAQHRRHVRAGSRRRRLLRGAACRRRPGVGVPVRPDRGAGLAARPPGDRLPGNRPARATTTNSTRCCPPVICPSSPTSASTRWIWACSRVTSTCSPTRRWPSSPASSGSATHWSVPWTPPRAVASAGVGTRRGTSESAGTAPAAPVRLPVRHAAGAGGGGRAAAADDHRRPGGDDPADPRDPGCRGPRCRSARWSSAPAVTCSPARTTSGSATPTPPRTPRSSPSGRRRARSVLAAGRRAPWSSPWSRAPMCAGAVVAARIGRVVYGAADPKAGAAGSLWDIPRDRRLNHRAEVIGGDAGGGVGAPAARASSPSAGPDAPAGPVGSTAVESPSGRGRTPRKRVKGQPFRGFESHLHRH